MKKYLLYVLVLSLALSFIGCGAQKPKEAVAEAQNEDELMVYDLMESFYTDSANINCVVSDHAVADDRARDLIGVVQYTDAENNPSCLSFIGAAGAQSIKLDNSGKLIPAKDSKLIYLGEGKASFLLEDKDSGKVYDYIVTYIKDGENVNIKTESKLLEE